MDIKQEELDIFKASASRMRWFISTAVLISVLIMLHVYLEQFSFQEAQLAGIEANRVFNRIPETQACYKELIKLEAPTEKPANIDNVPECSAEKIGGKLSHRLRSLSYEDLVREYSSSLFLINVTNNTIGAFKMPTRQIPILGTEIPANDFVVVMALMSMVFVVGVWLNLRGLHASLTSLEKHNDPDVMRIAQLNTVFLTALENDENTFAFKVRACALWLPFASIVIATIVGYAPVMYEHFSKSDSYAGSPATIVVFLVISILISVLHFLIALRCGRVMKEIDEVFKLKIP